MIKLVKTQLQKDKNVNSWSICQEKIRRCTISSLGDGTIESLISSEKEGIKPTIYYVRETDVEGQKINVLGSSKIEILSSDAKGIKKEISAAVLAASLQQNQYFELPEQSDSYPEVQMLDPEIFSKMQETVLSDAGDSARVRDLVKGITAQIVEAVNVEKDVKLNYLEVFFDDIHKTLLTSRGIDLSQYQTNVFLEFALTSGKGETEAEILPRIHAGRLADINAEELIKYYSQLARDKSHAQRAKSFSGPVVLRGEAVSQFFGADSPFGLSNPLIDAASARNKYMHINPFNIGDCLAHDKNKQSLKKEHIKGDKITILSNPLIDFGTRSYVFDEYGTPGGKVTLIEDSVIKSFLADSRIAQYLNIPVTGSFGNIQILPGSRTIDELLDSNEEIAVVESFSAFTAKPTGDFNTEIRFGYFIKNGKKTPLQSGLLCGNFFNMLEEVYFSKDTVLRGSYHGPKAFRAGELQIAGK